MVAADFMHVNFISVKKGKLDIEFFGVEDRRSRILEVGVHNLFKNPQLHKLIMSILNN